MTGNEAARILGISRSTLYRWAEQGIIPIKWTADTLAPYVGLRRPKGPPRRKYSLRYTVYRHRFDEKRGKRV